MTTNDELEQLIELAVTHGYQGIAIWNLWGGFIAACLDPHGTVTTMRTWGCYPSAEVAVRALTSRLGET